MLVDRREHTAMKAARRGLAVLKAGQSEIQSKMTVPLLWLPATEIDVHSCPTASSPILGEAEQKFALLAALRSEIHAMMFRTS
jgi:hypothetical protein